MEIMKVILHLEVSLSRTLYIQGFSANYFFSCHLSLPGSVRMEDFQTVVASICDSIHSNLWHSMISFIICPLMAVFHDLPLKILNAPS